MKISDSAFAAYLDCPYKAFLLIKKKTAASTAFGNLQSRLHQKLQPRIESEIVRAVSPGTVSNKANTTLSDLRRGSPLILNTTISVSPYSCQVAAVQRVEGSSSLGDFHYTPILFHEDTLTTSHKLLLGFSANVLGRIQGCMPSVGHIVSGTSCTLKKVSLQPFTDRVEEIISVLRHYAFEDEEPRRLLNSHCQICQFHPRCDSETRRTDDLSRLQRISETEIDKLNAKGIFTVHQLSHTFRPRKRPKQQPDSRHIPYHHSLKALAIREKKTHVFQIPPSVTASTRVYIDMEGDYSAKHIYLIGLLVVQAERQNYTSFWCDDQSGEKGMFEAMFSTLAKLDNCHLFHYGSYDGRALKRMLSVAQTESVKDLVTSRRTNILSHIHAQVYFPVYGNRLKDVAAFLGFKWTYPDYSGREVMLWRYLWELSHSAQIKSLLIKYNRDDCLALKLVHEALAEISARRPEEHTATPASANEIGNNKSTVSTDSLLHQSDYKEWGRREFACDEFRLMADSAYFDYQRNRIYVRTSESARRYQQRSRKRNETVVPRANSTVDHTVAVCARARCHGDELVLDYERGNDKYVYDLRISNGGIRRWITRHRMPEHKCASCERTFIPSRPPQQRLGHSLLAWAMHQHVSNRISLANLALTTRECFGLHLREWDFQRLKSMGADYYRTTYDDIVSKLTMGKVLHVDETSVKLRGHVTGYVWVFTTIESVVYMYRSTREGEFLHDLLRSFNGVLVTDFYTAYDSIPCPQQKCLVHLMWDINGVILKNPFDDELNSIGRTFGALMRDIVGSIDRFGLKKRYLRKHQRQSSAWLSELRENPRESAVAESIRKRITKTGDRLFTFLGYDGVPWNNNNAENSIKPFAKYRRLVRGRITEPGLRDYLVLLSIAQTCKYRSISFLDFLSSGRRNIPD